MILKQRLFTVLLGLLFATVLTDQAAALYDPGVGRFCSRDPIGYGDIWNIYSLANNGSLNSTDYSGMWTYRVQKASLMTTPQVPDFIVSHQFKFLSSEVPKGATQIVQYGETRFVVRRIDPKSGKCVSELLRFVDRKLDVVPIRNIPKAVGSPDARVWDDNWAALVLKVPENTCAITQFHDGWIGFNPAGKLLPSGTNQTVSDENLRDQLRGPLGNVSMVHDWIDTNRCQKCNCWGKPLTIERLHIGPTGDNLPGTINNAWHKI
jgi:hypothetical protein